MTRPTPDRGLTSWGAIALTLQDVPPVVVGGAAAGIAAGEVDVAAARAESDARRAQRHGLCFTARVGGAA